MMCFQSVCVFFKDIGINYIHAYVSTSRKLCLTFSGFNESGIYSFKSHPECQKWILPAAIFIRNPHRGLYIFLLLIQRLTVTNSRLVGNVPLFVCQLFMINQINPRSENTYLFLYQAVNYMVALPMGSGLPAVLLFGNTWNTTNYRCDITRVD